ncbi:AsmA family protein [Polycladidibacter hongkongensis]|uniref:AsmA family protein n=1 Tax=Polycladidibacter hongkongensis TaxID=1647556 RepID=UPI000A4039E5|nr:AsmA family protein [Pseudovibrio hongkongensis]
MILGLLKQGRGLVAGVVLAVILLGAVQYAAGQMLSPSVTKQALAGVFYEATGLRLRLDGKTRSGLWPQPHVLVENVGIAKETGAIEFLQAQSMELNLGWGALFGGNPQVAAIELHEPTIFLEVGADGRTNWQTDTRAPETRDAQQGSALTTLFQSLGLGDVAIKQAALVYENKQTEWAFRLDEVDFNVTRDGEDEAYRFAGAMLYGAEAFALEGRVGSGRSLVSGKSGALQIKFSGPKGNSLELAGQLAFGQVPLGSLRVSGMLPRFGALMRSFGLAGHAERPAAKIDGQLRFLADRMVSQGLLLELPQGAVALDLALTYMEDGSELRLNASGHGLPAADVLALFGGPAVDAGVLQTELSALSIGQGPVQLAKNLQLDGSARLENGRLRLGTAARDDLEGVGSAQDVKQLDDLDLEFSFSGIGELLSFQGTGRWLSEPVRMRGRLDDAGTLEAGVTGELFHANVKAPYQTALALTSGGAGEALVEVSTPELLSFLRYYRLPDGGVPSGQDLAFSGVLGFAKDSVKLRSATLQLGALDMRGTASTGLAAPYDVRGRVSLHGGSTADIMPWFQAGPQRKLRDRPLDLPQLRGADVDLDVAIRSFELAGLPLDSGRGSIVNKWGRLELQLSDAQVHGVAGGLVEGVGLVDVSRTEPEYQLEGQIANIPAQMLQSLYAPIGGVRGSVYGLVKMTASGADLDSFLKNAKGSLSLQVGQGELKGADWDGFFESLQARQKRRWPSSGDGATQFVSLGADIGFGEGVAELQALTLQTSRSLIEGQGRLDLKTRQVSGRLQPSRFDQEEVQEGIHGTAGLAVAAREITVSGSWAQPLFSLDTVVDGGGASSEGAASGVAGAAARELAAQLASKAAARRSERKLTTLEETVAPAEEVMPVAIDGHVVEGGPRLPAAKPKAAETKQIATPLGSQPVPPVAKPEQVIGTPLALLPEKGREKRQGVAPKTESVSQAPRPKAPARKGERGGTTVNVDAVVDGSADDTATLQAIEDGFGISPGFLTD